MMMDTDFLYSAILQNGTLALLVYVVLLLVVRGSRYYRLEKCPKCGGRLSRHKRRRLDKWTARLSLGILPVKRYRCYQCYWEGQAFNMERKGHS